MGVTWLRRTDGTCGYCVRGSENLCPASEYTGWDADGGYAEYTTVPAAFAYRLPGEVDDVALAPLLCAGIIGYRALLRAALPDAGRLGLYGFGGSAVCARGSALAQGATVHVLTREPAARRLALDLGAASARGAYDEPPEPLDSAILFAPVGDLVPVALRALDQDEVLRVAGIHLSNAAAALRERPVLREGAAQRRLQHPPGRAGLPGAGGAPRCTRHDARLPAVRRAAGPAGPQGRPFRRGGAARERLPGAHLSMRARDARAWMEPDVCATVEVA